MNHKLLPFVAAFLILSMVLGTTPFTYAVTRATIGPKLEVTTIPQDDQKREKGIIILGINPATPTAKVAPLEPDLMSQHKLLVTYNGAVMTWALGSVGVTIACNVLEKDKVNVVPDPKTGDGKQGDWENLMTKLVDVSDKFVCKPRWKSPTAGLLESSGVLDVYYVGPLPKAPKTSTNPALADPGLSGVAAGVWIADYIVVVEATITIGRTVVFGAEVQDICVLGWAVTAGALPNVRRAADWIITKPDGSHHYIWQEAFGNFVGCEELALAQRDALGILLQTGQDPLA
jgi:hypothetical protein